MPLASVDHCSISFMPERFESVWQIMHDGLNWNTESHIHRFYLYRQVGCANELA